MKSRKIVKVSLILILLSFDLQQRPNGTTYHLTPIGDFVARLMLFFNVQ